MLPFFFILTTGCQRAIVAQQYTSNVQSDTTQSLSHTTSDTVFLHSAYFGLDNALPEKVERLCTGGSKADGMPIVFSHELKVDTVQPGDIQIQLASGKTASILCTTFLPAIDSGELRTVLLIGELGSEKTDAPITARIVGNIYDHNQEYNFKGSSVNITPLSAGPFLVRAEVTPKSQWLLDSQSTPSNLQGSRCPKETKQAVRAVWSGGITKPGGKPADAKEGALYQISMATPSGEQRTITPSALADLRDGDNNHLLCLTEKGTPTAVSFPKGHLTDPNEDATNPDTTVSITPLPSH